MLFYCWVACRARPLTPEKGAATVNYDYLEEVISYLSEHFAFLPTARLGDFEKVLDKAARQALGTGRNGCFFTR